MRDSKCVYTATGTTEQAGSVDPLNARVRAARRRGFKLAINAVANPKVARSKRSVEPDDSTTDETIKMLIRLVEFLMSLRRQSIGRVARSQELTVLPAIIRMFLVSRSSFFLSSVFSVLKTYQRCFSAC